MAHKNEVSIRIGEKTYRLVTDDEYLDKITTSYEPDMVALFDSLVRASDCVLDVGANLGCTSILFGELSRQVVSFEPSPSTFLFLERNVRASGLANIVLQNVALGSEKGETEITFNPSNRSGGFISNRTKASVGHTTETVSIRRLDDVVESLHLPTVDFIKIDVEGYEQYVIEGASKTIDEFRPTIVLEMNHWCLNAFQRISIPDFLDFMRLRFPILLAVDGDTYADLHDASDSYTVMYHHIIHFKYANLVGAFSRDRLERFYQRYKRQNN